MFKIVVVYRNFERPRQELDLEFDDWVKAVNCCAEICQAVNVLKASVWMGGMRISTTEA